MSTHPNIRVSLNTPQSRRAGPRPRRLRLLGRVPQPLLNGLTLDLAAIKWRFMAAAMCFTCAWPTV